MYQNQPETDRKPVPIVQFISIWWSKTSRGGLLAEHRNQIPRAFPLPTPPATYDRFKHYMVHRIQFDEQNQFLEPLREAVEAPKIDIPFRTLNCSVEVTNETPIVKFHWQDGAPIRPYPTKAFHIKEREWMRLEYNARFSCRDFGMWSYKHEIINVALTDPETRDIFVATEPNDTYQDLAHLW